MLEWHGPSGGLMDRMVQDKHTNESVRDMQANQTKSSESSGKFQL